MSLLKRYKKLGPGGSIQLGTDAANAKVAGLSDVVPGLTALGASAVGNGDQFGFRTQGGIVGKSAFTGAGIGSQIGKNFGPIGTLVGAGAGAVYGSMVGLLTARGKQRKWLNEQEKLNFQQSQVQTAASDAAIAGDPTLLTGNRNAQMFGNGGRISLGKEFDAVPTIAYSLKAFEKVKGNEQDPIFTNAHTNLKNSYGEDTANEILSLARQSTKSSINNLAKNSRSNNPYVKSFYQIVNENPDTWDRYTYGFDETTTAKMADGGTIPAPLTNAYMRGGKAKPLSSSSVEINGKTHKQGGVEVPQVGAELEDGETTKDGFVFSERLGFAKLHKPIAKAIGKIEIKPQTRERVNSLRLLKERETQLAVAQEQYKQVNGIQ